MNENLVSVGEWCLSTFGPTSSNIRIAIRLNEELAELLKELSQDDNSKDAAKEMADVQIVLYHLAWLMNVDLEEEVNKKMLINRNRKWKLDSNGCGYHIKELVNE